MKLSVKGVFVLGMHRSGTSATTRVLDLLGVSTGFDEKTVERNQANPTGYWENTQVRRLNEGILRSAHASWDYPFATGVPCDPAPPLAERMARILSQLGQSPWVLKDPRFCFTIAAWLNMLDSAICVLVYRNPLEVAISLLTREGWPVEYSLALWEFYNLAAFHQVGRDNTIVVNYEDLCENPSSLALTLKEQLASLGLSSLTNSNLGAIASFVRPEGNRSQELARNLRLRRYLTDSQLALWDDLCASNTGLFGRPAVLSRETMERAVASRPYVVQLKSLKRMNRMLERVSQNLSELSD